MKRTIIVQTNFSDSDTNAVSYPCKFTLNYNLNILLLGVFTGLWHSLFNKSYTKQLALLNDLPVMAIHDND